MMINGVEIGSFVLLIIVSYELNDKGAAAFISPASSSFLGNIHKNERSHHNSRRDRTNNTPQDITNDRIYDNRSGGGGGSALFERGDRRRGEQGYRRQRQQQTSSSSSDVLVVGSDPSSSSRRKDATVNRMPRTSSSRTPSHSDETTANTDPAVAISPTMKQQRQHRDQSSSSSSSSEDVLSLNDGTEEPMKTLTMETLNGGPSLIFAMARRMLFLDDDDGSYPRQREANTNKNKKNNNNDRMRPRTRRVPRPMEKIVPRWHPHDGIADANPSFRMEPPAMNNRGYASIIRRNSRKRGKVSLWRHALRMYDKMKAEELEQQHLIRTKKRHPSTATILRTTEHFEAASVACAKLGLWREVLGIYSEIVDMESTRDDLAVTDNLILSLVGACVRSAKMRRKQKFVEEEQRIPLDAAREILVALEVNHGIPLASRHVNPLAAAYQHIGLTVESSVIVQTLLVNRLSVAPVPVGFSYGSESFEGNVKYDNAESDAATAVVDYADADDADDADDDADADADTDTDDSQLIVNTQSKDKASYNILVQGAILEGNWTTAIDSLRNMTDAGLYPNNRNLNIWSETAKKRELRGGGRRMRSWKKKRERMLVRGTLPPAGIVTGSLLPGP